MAARPARAWSAFPSRPSSCGWARARRRLAGQGPSAPGGYQLRGCARARTACRAPAAKALGPRAISGPSPLGLSGAAAPSAGERRGPGPRGRARGGRRGPQQGEARRSQRPARGSSGARVHPGRGATGLGGGGGRRRPDPQRGPLQAPGGRGRGGSSGPGSALTPRPGDRGWEGEGRKGGRGAAGGVPGRCSVRPERSSRLAEPLGAPRPGRADIERRGAAPRVSARRLAEPPPRESLLGPGRLRCALLPPPLGRAPRRRCSSGPAEGGRLRPAVCRGKRRRPGGGALGSGRASSCGPVGGSGLAASRDPRPPRAAAAASCSLSAPPRRSPGPGPGPSPSLEPRGVCAAG